MTDGKINKKTGYTYKINGIMINTKKKLYVQDGIYGHKKGDFFEPCSQSLLFKIMMAKLEPK